jgi:hypothetical protein
MTQKEILKNFREMVALHANQIPQAKVGESVATIYGTDQVKVDIKRNRIKLAEFGWLDLDKQVHLDSSAFDWIGLFRDNSSDDFIIVFGDGNPFLLKNAVMLPQKNGFVLAIPASFSKL